MRTQHFLLLSSIALSSPALAAEPKPTANANRRLKRFQEPMRPGAPRPRTK